MAGRGGMRAAGRARSSARTARASAAEAAPAPTQTWSENGMRAEGVNKTFRGQPVLTDADLDVNAGEVVALVGWNGSGKTTLLKIVTGEIEADAGEVLTPPHDSLGVLGQEFDVDDSITIRQELMRAFGDASGTHKRIEQAESDIEAASADGDMDRMQRALEELEHLRESAGGTDGTGSDGSADAERRLRNVSGELGLWDELDRSVGELSGGWKMRVALGKMLLRAKDLQLMLLDEPTNHLDLEATEWFESYLNRTMEAKGTGTVVVSHDREFLDRVATKTVEIDLGKTRIWKNCNYSRFAEAKAEWAEQQHKRWDKWKKELDEKRALIQRLEGGDNAGRAEQAKKEVDSLLQNEPEKPFEEKRKRFRFPKSGRSGRVVASIENLTHYSPSGRLLFNSANLTVERGDRVALIGRNGAGKSTLLRLLLGQAEISGTGVCALGHHNMLVNHFEQNQAEALDLDETALSTVERAAAEALEQRSIEEKDRDREGGSQADADVNAKALLGRMGFKGEAMERQVSALSGGEKARLALAQFVATPANVLLLDEPTNHMDIPSREALEEAVQNFDGTVIAASHDRYFLKQIATRVVYVGENAARGLEEDLAEGEALQAEAQRIRGADDGADNGEQAPGGNGKGSKKKGKKQKQKGGKR